MPYKHNCPKCNGRGYELVVRDGITYEQPCSCWEDEKVSWWEKPGCAIMAEIVLVILPVALVFFYAWRAKHG